MLTLRYELHLLVHAFRKDVVDPERGGITSEHMPFYYGKYLKKVLNPAFYGVTDALALLELVQDVVMLCPEAKVLEALVPEDMVSPGVFAMITEEARRDRHRRLDLGDESARLKLQTSPAHAAFQQSMQGAQPQCLRPNPLHLHSALVPAGPRPVVSNLVTSTAGLRPASLGVAAARPVFVQPTVVQPAGLRPNLLGLVQPSGLRPTFPQAWRPTWPASVRG